MKVALVGASGNVGSRLLAELVRRGHQVTAIARHPEKIEVSQSITPAKGDLFDDATLAQVLSGHEAVISSVRFMMSDPPQAAERCSGVGCEAVSCGWRCGQPRSSAWRKAHGYTQVPSRG